MKTKRELRQEAVERLKNLDPMNASAFRMLYAIIGGHAYYTNSCCTSRDRLIDILTDDGPTEDDYLDLLRDAAREYQISCQITSFLEGIQSASFDISLGTNDSDMIALPEDVGGKAIHLNDVMGDEYGTVFIVKRLEYSEYGWLINGQHKSRSAEECNYLPYMCYHYHEPTIEDVLTEFVTKLDERGHLSNGVAMTVAEYAKKLQLKED